MKRSKYLLAALYMLVISTVVEAQQQKYAKPDSIYTVVDQQPEFPGGQVAMYAWLGKHTKNVDSTEDNLLSMRTFISFVVAKDGRLSNFQPGKLVFSANTKKGVKQAKQIVQNMINALEIMPHWRPGKCEGKPVRATYYLPIWLELD